MTFAASLAVEHAGNYERGTSTSVWYDPANHERLATAWDVARDDAAETLGRVAFSLGMLALVPLWLLRTGLIMAALLHGDGLRETRIAQVRTVQRYKDRYTLARFEGESTPYTMRRGLGNLRAGPAVATGPGYWRLAMSRGGRPYLLRHPGTPGGRRRWINELGPPGRPRHRRARRR